MNTDIKLDLPDKDSKEYKKLLLNIELMFLNEIIDLDKQVIEKGKIFCPDTFISPTVFAIIYCVGGLFLSLVNKTTLDTSWFFTGVAITIGLSFISVFIKWVIWGTLVNRAKDSVKHYETETLKLKQDLKELDEQ